MRALSGHGGRTWASGRAGLGLQSAMGKIVVLYCVCRCSKRGRRRYSSHSGGKVCVYIVLQCSPGQTKRGRPRWTERGSAGSEESRGVVKRALSMSGVDRVRADGRRLHLAVFQPPDRHRGRAVSGQRRKRRPFLQIEDTVVRCLCVRTMCAADASRVAAVNQGEKR